jgi:hypothetical protein
MTFMSARIKSYPVIPEEEQKCIWMMNGSVSYKLCDRNYECESCPFYHAIKNGKRGEGDFPESRGDWTGEGSLDSDPSIQINGTGDRWLEVLDPSLHKSELTKQESQPKRHIRGNL